MRRSGLFFVFAAMLLSGRPFDIASAAQPVAPIHPELAISLEPIVPLEQGWRDPPLLARTQCWWWWLNGNVTKAAITRDLEEMKAKGIGGANIIDAGGANQRGHAQVPHGPDFATPAWQELFLHALAEADRLGLELGFNIQSGWNLGGPTVDAEHASKKLVWAETTVEGERLVDVELPRPQLVGNFYRDVALLAVPMSPGGDVNSDARNAEPQKVDGKNADAKKPAAADRRANAVDVKISADSFQQDYPAARALDGDPLTFWVSGSDQPGQGPSTERPVLVKLEFSTPVSATELAIQPRDEYGPKRGWLQAADTPQNWRIVARWTAEATGQTLIRFPRTTARMFRLVIVDAHDPRSPLLPRNAQIAEIEMRDGPRVVTHDPLVQNADAVAGEKNNPATAASSGSSAQSRIAPPSTAQLARIDNFLQKAYHQYPGPFTAPNAEHLLNVGAAGSAARAAGPPATTVIRSSQVVDITQHVDDGRRLRWNAPPGTWKLLRFGYTLSGARVSTSSEGWNGWAIDYLDPRAFERYWSDVAGPLMAVAKPYLGRSLKFLHTDSWELGPVNWTPQLPQEFARRRGYSLTRYLPAAAGYVVDDAITSNRFLNDFRRTLADLIADGKYATFQKHAHRLGLGIHPESGGPHAAPIDALMCVGRNDIAMGEFWARSATHRTRDFERLFTKQPASAAHVYGRRVVLAEAFTSIGPQWEESPRDLKPVFDQVACEGLNLVMLHTFDCSPDEMGSPGQAYFAGTHFNRHITWWPHADAFLGYMNRCQFLLQQGLPVSDVLYFYGENVPSFVRLKADDPAHVLPGYDYDVINAEALLARTAVRNGQIVLPEGTAYQVLVLPDRDSYSLRTLEYVATLVAAGATVSGRKPTGPIGLAGDPQYAAKFRSLADRLWKADGTSGPGIRAVAARDVLARRGLEADFVATGGAEGELPNIDFIHRRTSDADIYFLANRLDRYQDADCSFRIQGRQPELWDPISEEIRDAGAFSQTAARTIVPLRFPPNGSMFVIFRRAISPSTSGSDKYNEPRPAAVADVQGPWQVEFQSRLGGPSEAVVFERLTSWSTHAEPAIRYYSGPAVYRTAFDLPVGAAGSAARAGETPAPRRWWLDLGAVKNIAAVRLNGRELGVAWTDPFRIELTAHVKPTGNQLEIEVINLWPNRLIGDLRLPAEERITRTNISKFRENSPLLESGLLGPVRLMSH